ncbi:MAG: hypothetical protein M3220_03055 [Chloroflexota bacterium]|nr:hypothetical protein [Chloroflexota bacterium]
MAQDYTIRHYQPGEEQKMANLVNVSDAEEEGITVTADLIRDEWSDPRLNLARDTWVAVNEAGEYIAVAEVWFEEEDEEDEESTIRHIGFTMHPDYRESHADLMEHLYSLAVERARSHPMDLDKEYYLRAWASANDAWKREWLLDHGFEYVHCGFTLLYDNLANLPAIPNVHGARIEPWSPERDDDLWQALNEGFSDDETFVPLAWEEWQAIYHGSARANPSLWRLAIDIDTEAVVGLALTEIVDIAPDVGSPREGWVTDLTVVEPWRGRGLRRALLIAALHALHDAGVSAVLMGLDSAQPESATRLPDALGFKILRGSCTYHKPLNTEG